MGKGLLGCVVVLLLAALALGAAASRALWPSLPPPKFTQLTFRRGIVLSARMTPDGHTVVYSALWDGASPEVFSRRLDNPASVAPLNGGRPVTISYSTAPSEKRSVRTSTSSPRACSGDM